MPSAFDKRQEVGARLVLFYIVFHHYFRKGKCRPCRVSSWKHRESATKFEPYPPLKIKRCCVTTTFPPIETHVSMMFVFSDHVRSTPFGTCGMSEISFFFFEQGRLLADGHTTRESVSPLLWKVQKHIENVDQMEHVPRKRSPDWRSYRHLTAWQTGECWRTVSKLKKVPLIPNGN